MGTYMSWIRLTYCSKLSHFFNPIPLIHHPALNRNRDLGVPEKHLSLDIGGEDREREWRVKPGIE
ncbi:unnamed protein product [Sphenostylis stenocarpa]|uniref:Uncharacterized protein n=1 Tax=Sphenostylis stenocarpa TaxID=92480 RepID=A0AA86TMQ2_9FABA|nr:unnamed protein product [Sphenostylis stenocarpa]